MNADSVTRAIPIPHPAIAWLRDDAAIAADRARAQSAGLPLGGMPYMVKDLYDVAGVPTHAGSSFLARVRPLPARDCALVRDVNAAGGVLVGKTHLHEFAFGMEGTNRTWGDCPHPHRPGRLCGGSSSGSAWVVARGCVPVAFGTDTAGSVRVPAAFCGLHAVRLAPGHPWVREGCFPLAPSFDTPGWFARDAATHLRLLGLFAGTAPDDPRPLLAWMPAGVPFDPGVREAILAHPLWKAARHDDPATRALDEACSDLPLHYGVLGSREAHAVHADLLEAHAAEYDPVVRARLLRARHWTASHIEAALSCRNRLRGLMRKLLQDHAGLLIPSTPIPAPTPARMDDPLRQSLLRLNTPVSMAGLPALLIPVPLDDDLSTGLQVVAARPDHLHGLLRCAGG